MRVHSTFLRARVDALGPWFHNLDLDGVQTAPNHFLGDYPRSKFRRFAELVPTHLNGRSVLDIGCNAGFYSFEMARRGAARVLGIDTDERYLAQARLAQQVIGASDVEFRNLSIYDVAALSERFDLVLFMGVLYHLRHPLLALDLLHAYATRGLLLFQSMLRGAAQSSQPRLDDDFADTAFFDEPTYPKLHFIEHHYAGDWTNWWAPNRACAEAMLRSAGFEIIGGPLDEVFLCRRSEPAHPVAPTHPALPHGARDPS